MPALLSSASFNHIVSRNISSAASNLTTTDGLQVVCAFPVSGQYGPGSRYLYYVLVAACVFARKSDWLRNACLAAALLFPAVAALHGIVLAAVHVEHAVDMDVFGAFQLCSIGVLAAPVTVKLSSTYFYDPGRNIIFTWTALILAGLLSLTVEFFRISTSTCLTDDAGSRISSNSAHFPYGNATCNLQCSTTDGPFSPLRGGSANNIYVIPAPHRLSFNTATLLAAACSIPAILSLVSMWNKILEINWKNRAGKNENVKGSDNELIDGTNGATIKKMKGVNSLIRVFLSAVEIPLFGAAVLAIVIIGERNFWSPQVRYQTEPIASVGQWQPIAGTVLAVLGSLYILLAADMEVLEEETHPNVPQKRSDSLDEDVGLGLGPIGASAQSVVIPAATHTRQNSSEVNRRSPDKMVPTSSHHSAPTTPLKRSWTIERGVGKRREVAKALTAIGNYLGTARKGTFDDTEFRDGEAQDFPEIPGERHRNNNLRQIQKRYNHYRNEDGDLTPRPASRASFTGSTASALHCEQGDSITPEEGVPLSTSPRRPQIVTLLEDRASFDLQYPTTSPVSNPTRTHQRGDTLEVPTKLHHRSNSTSSFTSLAITSHDGQTSPTIIVSSDPDPASHGK